MKEISRVIKDEGKIILVIPQTANLHIAPYHFQNFTRFWIDKVAEENELKIIEYIPQGGFWSSLSSRCFYFFLQISKYPGSFDPRLIPRKISYYLLLPFAVITCILLVPWFLILSLGDLGEEPNNHIAVLAKIA